MAGQDNRSTAFPLFIIQEKKRRWVPPELDWHERERKDEFDLEDLCKECQALDGAEKEIILDCDDCSDSTYDHFVVSREPNLKAGVFFTAEACEEHIAENAYHYKEPSSYAISAWRNVEVQQVMVMLLNEGGGEVPSAYK